jgi:septum formation protein
MTGQKGQGPLIDLSPLLDPFCHLRYNSNVMEPIILASGSPRRQEFFKLLGLPFTVCVSQADESFEQGSPPGEITAELAQRKVRAADVKMAGRSPQWICGADTVVALDGEILGKPKDREDASRMLHLLSGREHSVWSSVALYRSPTGEMKTRTVESHVRFAELSESEIEWYLDTGEWQGVAGGYKIQGLAACLVEGIDGSYTNIVGLPLHQFYDMMKEMGYPYGAR